jgi:serine/threonine protein kinase
MKKKPVLQYNALPILFLSTPLPIDQPPYYHKAEEPLLPLTNQIMGKYFIYAGIGSGGYANVFLAYDLIQKEWIALKVFLNKEDGLGQAAYQTERGIHQLLSEYPECDPNIVCMYDFGVYSLKKAQMTPLIRDAFQRFAGDTLRLRRVKPSFSFIVLELMDIDLFEWTVVAYERWGKGWVSQHARLIQSIWIQILQGLDLFHSLGLSHHDLKTENILVSFLTSSEDFWNHPEPEKLDIKIGDFGGTCTEQEKWIRRYEIPECTGTHTPEIVPLEFIRALQEASYQNDDVFEYPIELYQKTDLWAYGLIILEYLRPDLYNSVTYLAALAPNNEKAEDELETFIRNVLPDELQQQNIPEIPKVWYTLAAKLLRFKPKQRPNAKNILKQLHFLKK